MQPYLDFTIGAARNTHLHFKVKVWRTWNQLQSARKKAGSDTKEKINLCDAFCHKFNNRHCNDLMIGEIHFCLKKLSVENIAHESLHAAVCYLEWIRPFNENLPEDSRDLVMREPIVEEALAYSTGYLTEGIYWNLQREKLKVKP